MIQKSIIEGVVSRILAWRWRGGQNAGAMRDKKGYVVRMGPEGMADIGGIMRDGRALQIEVKRQGQNVKEGSAQAEWLERVREGRCRMRRGAFRGRGFGYFGGERCIYTLR